MELQYYNPFRYLEFQQNICFLTGKKLETDEQHTVAAFPEWLVERYHLQDASIAMLGGNRMKYKDMLLPASQETAAAIKHLDSITQTAFEHGYDAVIQLPEHTIFQWMARVLYGVLYQDLVYAIRQHQAKGKNFQISDVLQLRLKNLHLMLQSLVTPIEFNGFVPWSMKCYSVNISKDILNYKDETQDLNFCLGMNGFGIIACLQDNGAVAQFNHDVLEKIGAATLHPAQFEELYGRFVYSNYLLRKNSSYMLTESNGKLIFNLPEDVQNTPPQFATWQDEVFAQVLANLWRPWGITLEKIHQFPNSPISYLIDERTYQFIEAEKVDLPF